MRHLSLLTLLIAAAFFLVTRPSIRGNDGVQNYAYLHSVLFDNDLDFTNQYAWYFTRQAGWFNEQEIPKDPTTGLPINLYGVGSSLLWTPWVLAGHGTGYLLNAAGFPVHLNGFSYLYEVAVGLGSCFYASIGLWLLVRLLRRRAGPEPAFWSVLLIWLASPLFFYMYLHPSMSHANSFFLSSLLLYLYLEKSQGRRSRVTWGLMGAVAGLLVITRFQDAALLSILAVGELLRGRESKWDTLDEAAQPEQLPFSSDQHRAASHLPPRLPSYGCFALCFMIALIPQLIAWHILQGSALSGPRGYISQGTIRLWAPIHAPDVLFSSRHGLFFWHPGLLMASQDCS